MLKNGAASVMSSSDTVGGGGEVIRGGCLNKGAFIDGFYLLVGRSFEGAFIQSITVIRTCFRFWIFYVFQCHLFPIHLSQLVIFQEMRYILKSTDKFPQYLLGTA